MTDLSSMTYDALSDYFKKTGEPAFRAKQVFGWFARGAVSFAEMTDLSKALRDKLSAECVTAHLTVVKKLSDSDGTVKYLFELSDGNLIETVVMKYNHGNSVCISSQAGCKMGCRFCASTLNGKSRDLTAGEMLAQVAYANKENGVTGVVVMGVGEPLDNYDNLLIFLKNIHDERGMNISHRHISVSTCGIVDKIDRLAAENFQITLSISLHAPDDETRNKLMPINSRWGVDELMSACRRYFAATGRRISFEYTLVDGINCSASHAKKLVKLLGGMMCHINLIPVNFVAERGLYPPDAATERAFYNILKQSGLNVTVRRTLGGEINASCGQLRYSNIKK